MVFCAQHGYKPLSYDILVYQTVRGRPYSYIPVRSRDFLEFARLDPDKTFPPSTTFRQSSLNYRRRCVPCGFGFYRIILGASRSASSLADCELNHASSSHNLRGLSERDDRESISRGEPCEIVKPRFASKFSILEFCHQLQRRGAYARTVHRFRG